MIYAKKTSSILLVMMYTCSDKESLIEAQVLLHDFFCLNSTHAVFSLVKISLTFKGEKKENLCTSFSIFYGLFYAPKIENLFITMMNLTNTAA